MKVQHIDRRGPAPKIDLEIKIGEPLPRKPRPDLYSEVLPSFVSYIPHILLAFVAGLGLGLVVGLSGML